MIFGIENFRFESPLYLLLLLLIPFIVLYELKYKPRVALIFPNVAKVKKASINRFLLTKYLPLLLRVIIIALFVLGIARPQKGKSNAEVLTEGINIVLAIDTSGSMKAVDLELNGERVTRLEVVKSVVKNFINKRINDPIGLIVFGTSAFTQCPLTLDYNILSQFIDNLEIGMAGESTSIGNSIGLSVKRLRDLPGKSKIIILLTDGSNTAGKLDPDKAAEIANKLGIKVYTVGVGSSGKVPFIQDTFLGPQTVYMDSDLDEQTLKKIAQKTNAKYYRAKNTNELNTIYNDIDKLEKSNFKIKKYMEYQELFSYLIIPALFLFLLEVLLNNTKFLRVP